MSIYIYNCNNKNEFLTTIDAESLAGWEGTATLVPNVSSQVVGKSFAFNTETNAWDIEIDDWRGVLLYYKTDSRLTKNGKVEALPDEYTNIVPPDTENRYVFENGAWTAYEPPRPSVEETLKQYEDAVQNHIDTTAQARGYDNGYTCASYYDDKNARYKSDAKIFKDWRSDVWVYVNELLNEWKAGTLQVIPTIEELIEQLPKIVWEDIAETEESAE